MIFRYDGNRYRFIRVPNECGHLVNTECLLQDSGSDKEWTIGQSKLHPHDNNKFNKAIGKIIAFSHGLQFLEFNRDYRKLAMDEFMKQLPNLPKGVC